MNNKFVRSSILSMLLFSGMMLSTKSNLPISDKSGLTLANINALSSVEHGSGFPVWIPEEYDCDAPTQITILDNHGNLSYPNNEIFNYSTQLSQDLISMGIDFQITPPGPGIQDVCLPNGNEACYPSICKHS